MTAGSLDARIVVERAGGFRLDASVSAAPGEIVAVMGPSGAGKSTLLAALAGLERMTGGSVRIGDDEVASASKHTAVERRGVVLLGQDARLFPHLDARANVAFGLRARGMPKATAAAHADAWLERVGLADRASERPASLSGGQQQRVALARALATEPRLMLLDEPLTSLDPETAAEVRTVIRAQLDTTAIVVTHDALDAAALARRLLVLENGAVTQEGLVADVLTAPATRFAAIAAGLNRVEGRAQRGHCAVDGVVLRAEVAASVPDGTPLAAVFSPSAVRIVSPERGTANAWTDVIVRTEPTAAGARLHVRALPIGVDVGVGVIAARRLLAGTTVTLDIAPADVRLVPVTPKPLG